jgi:hypothetical protein
MAVVGGALVMLRMIGTRAFGADWRATVMFLAAIAFVSNALWLPVGWFFARHRPSLLIALLVGAILPVAACALVYFPALRLVARWPYIFFPVGILTAYFVWRVTTSDRDRAAPA